MEKIQATRTVHTVGQFLDWQKSGTLELSPIFQRRAVWKPSAKSQLIDSVVRGFPVPIILLRQVQDLESLSMKMEVVDGQQRLRTLLSFIDPHSLRDYNENNDSFTVRSIHNREIGQKPFAKLGAEIKQAILGYELSTHVFPSTTGDDLVFRIFARLNSTGLSLRNQEIRNAEFHGHFKTVVYDLAIGSLDYWRSWKVFSDDQIGRMDEAEAVSEYLMAMQYGIQGKTKSNIDKSYKNFDDFLPNSEFLVKRFQNVLSVIDRAIGSILADSAFSRPALFYSLYVSVYHHMYGLKSEIDNKRAHPLPKEFSKKLQKASDRIKTNDLPEKVQDAMDRATADKARRDLRHNFLMKALDLEKA